MGIWEMIVAIILGFVEGLTEFAPVSSTGHMIIVDELWLRSGELYSEPVANTFKVVIQLGSILAVVVIFKDKFTQMLHFKKGHREQLGRLKLSQVIVGILPACVLGFVFEDYIDTHLFSVKTVIFGLAAGAILMIFADHFQKNRPFTTISVDKISYKQAFGMGLFQCIGLWPGFSRSGSTMSGGVLLGMSHRASADFTFIMAVPIMLGASSLSLLKNLQYFTFDALPFVLVGFISAFVFALVSIRFFLKLINRIKLVPFAIYRILLAGTIYLLYF
ncbi:undecaprenyl-diphosphatase [Halobacillus andaensis]|uniref:Undecaprenyl-diphosphatase n=1 Tax=Halobacillus andaensis TaxID=1176239 RepID=A0A917B6W6_HALAA|nr:undecaprenyl-diphosphate phosphatase [Halobacillus andaensis]MBP2005048.1 undecaprenyl-diphosphatase [Halobacillus andaensis]GGF28479.1 undecaprenyl-diphosphatase [Halobacillus andaensis]